MSRLVLISLAIFLSPFAIFSKKRIMPTFWLNLILTLIFSFQTWYMILWVVTKES